MFVQSIIYQEIAGLVFFVASVLLMLKNGYDPNNLTVAIARVGLVAAWQVIAANVLWRFGKKYWHVAHEIPKMYIGELSHMEHTRKWSTFNTAYMFFLVAFNAI